MFKDVVLQTYLHTKQSYQKHTQNTIQTGCLRRAGSSNWLQNPNILGNNNFEGSLALSPRSPSHPAVQLRVHSPNVICSVARETMVLLYRAAGTVPVKDVLHSLSVTSSVSADKLTGTVPDGKEQP